MAADNSLSEESRKDLNKIKNGSNDNCHLVISYHGQKNGQKISERFVAANQKLYFDGKHEPKDSGLAKTFQEDLAWASEFNANKIMVIVWSHGNGIINKINKELYRSIIVDGTTGSFLTDIDLKNIFETAHAISNRKTDIILLDACLMGSLEICFALKDSAKYLIASEDILPVCAFNYEKIIKKLETQNYKPEDLCKVFVTSYYSTHNYFLEDFAIFTYNLEYIEKLAKNISTTGKILDNLILEKDKEKYKIIYGSLISSIKFSDLNYIDLGSFYYQLKTKVAGTTALSSETKKEIILHLYEGYKILTQKILTVSAVSLRYKSTTGLSIYFPYQEKYHESYDNTFWTYHYPEWSDFIKSFLKIINSNN